MSLTEEQQRALVHRADETLVIAAAGSGKTRLLIERLFLALETPGGDIVAITFTERAAEEMRERAEARAKKLSRKVQREFATRVRITTIDGFCLATLSEYPLFVAPPGRRLLPEGDDRAFVAENLWAVLHDLRDAVSSVRPADLERLVAQLFDKRRLRAHLTYGDSQTALNALIVTERQRLFDTCVQDLQALQREAPSPAEKQDLAACVVGFANAPDKMIERAVVLVNGRRWSGEARFVRDRLKRHQDDVKALSSPRSPEADALLRSAWRACDELLARYQAWKRERDAFDFVDLGHAALQLCEDPVAGPDLALRIGHLLIDEVQDTNPLQERLLSVWGKQAKVFRVGDPRQAIYGFRDAEVESILDKAASLPPGDQFSLTRNHRSLPAIVNLANAMLVATAAPLATDAMTAARTEPGPMPRLWLARGEGGRIALQVAATVAVVKERLSAGLQTKDIAVLCRRRGHVHQLHEALLAAGVACSVRTKRDLAELAATHDAIALLGAIEHPDDDALVFAALRTGAFGATIDEVTAIAAARAGTSAWHELQRATLSERASQALAALVKATQARGRRQAILARFLEEAGAPLSGYLPVLDVLSGCDDLDLELDALTRRLLAAQVEEVSGDDDGVQLLTQHGAKGLEWKCVVLPFLGEPLTDRRGDGVIALPNGAVGVVRDDEPAGAALALASERRQLAEELRLFYVAMTRARDELWLVARATQKMAPLDPTRITSPLLALRAIHDFGPPPEHDIVPLPRFELALLQL